jgi:uncharacterized membrane protein
MRTGTSNNRSPQQLGGIAVAVSFIVTALIFGTFLSPAWLAGLAAAITSLAIGVFVKKVVERRRMH